jgi:hypothetical protein
MGIFFDRGVSMEIGMSPLVELAESLVAQARKGDRRAVREVLHGARLNLSGIVNQHQPPDQEGVIYFRFLIESLERLLDEERTASQAFRWATNSRPQAVSTDDKFKLFLEVAREYEEIMEIGSDKPIATAIKAVARRHKVSSETIRKSGWEEFGGSEGWTAFIKGLSEPAGP